MSDTLCMHVRHSLYAVCMQFDAVQFIWSLDGVYMTQKRQTAVDTVVDTRVVDCVKGIREDKRG